MRNKILKFTDFELECFVRERLGQKDIFDAKLETFSKQEHKRFDFTGFNEVPDDVCFIKNQQILFLFADCGIYDFIDFSYICAWKGSLDFHYKLWREDEVNEISFSGYGTVEIIKDIIKKLFIDQVKAGKCPKHNIEYNKTSC